VDIVAYGTFVLADHLTETQSDAKYVQQTHTGNVDITGSITADGLTINSGTSNTVANFESSDAGAYVKVTDPTGTSSIAAEGQYMYLDVDKDAVVASSQMRFRVDGSTKMTLDDSGNLGIGTTDPVYAIHSKSSSGATGIFESTAADSTIYFKDSGTTYNYSNGIGSVGNALRFRSGDGSEAARFDASGNFLIGTQSYDSNAEGVGIGADAFFYAARTRNTANSSQVASFNRKGTDGDIVRFDKSGVTAGFIGVSTSGVSDLNLRITSGDVGLRFRPNDDSIVPIQGNGSFRDNAIDLGLSNARFRDIRLSGTSYANNTQLDLTPTNGDSPIAVKIVNNASGSGTGGRVVMGAGSGSLSQTAGMAGFYDGAGTSLALYTATNYGSTTQAERLRINRNGSVLIGTTTDRSGVKLGIDGGAADTFIHVDADSFNGTYRSGIRFSATTISAPLYYQGEIAFEGNNNYSGDMTFSTAAGGTTNPVSERMRLTAGGELSIGTNTPTRHGQTTRTLIYNGSTTASHAALHCSRNGTGTEFQVAFSNAYGVRGTITTTASAVAYNTTSDYRLKENVTDVTDGITRVKQLAPKRFNFIVDPDTTVDGFIAHEVQDVIPEAISGAKDAMRDEEYEVTPAVEATFDEDGNILTEAVDAVMGTRSVPDYQGIDQSKLVPLLTAALQEAITKIEDLEARVAALET
jgi:hypothetical protein